MAQNNSAILVQNPRVTFFRKKNYSLKPYLYHNSNRVIIFKNETPDRNYNYRFHLSIYFPESVHTIYDIMVWNGINPLL